MGKFMQWAAAITLYLGLSLATFNRNLDPKEGTYADKGVQTTLTAGREGATGKEIYNLDWSAVKSQGVKINPAMAASKS